MRQHLRMGGPDQAIEVVRRILAGDYTTDEEAESLVNEFASLVPDPKASDLIFWPNQHPLSSGLSENELTPELIVELAHQYRPFEL